MIWLRYHVCVYVCEILQTVYIWMEFEWTLIEYSMCVRREGTEDVGGVRIGSYAFEQILEILPVVINGCSHISLAFCKTAAHVRFLNLPEVYFGSSQVNRKQYEPLSFAFSSNGSNSASAFTMHHAHTHTHDDASRSAHDSGHHLFIWNGMFDEPSTTLYTVVRCQQSIDNEVNDVCYGMEWGRSRRRRNIK